MREKLDVSQPSGLPPKVDGYTSGENCLVDGPKSESDMKGRLIP